MRKLKSVFLSILFIALLIWSSYQTFTLIKIGKKLSAEDFSIGTTRASGYNFSASSNLDELPDMAGGC